MAKSKVFSYVNWEVVSGYSPLFTESDHEAIKSCDGKAVEDNGKGMSSLQTSISS